MQEFERLYPEFLRSNQALKLMNARMGGTELPNYKPDTVKGANHMANRLDAKGGFAQQDRMIRDKRKSLDKATKYSYQAALVRKYIQDYIPTMDGVRDNPPVRALINPNKLKQDYDDKIISVGFEHGFAVGDIFEWCNTGTYWLIYLQDLTELAYFRGDIRKCSYEIAWLDEEGNQKSTYGALRGPVETKINYIQKHGISVDTPNYSLNILMPKNEDTVKYFKRYAKFYITSLDTADLICWRVEAVDSISTPGIIEINAIEYYINETEDDIEQGIVGGLIEPVENPNSPEEELMIVGETFIKPKKTYEYKFNGDAEGKWQFNKDNLPITYEIIEDKTIKIKWISTYSGQFELSYGDYTKTIVIESLF